MDEPIGKYFIENDSLQPDALLRAALRPLGGSVYEVIRIVERTPLFLDDHVGRLARSASLSGYPFTATAARVLELVVELTNACDIASGNIRLVYGRDDPAQKPTFIVHFIQSRYPDDEMYGVGVRAGLLGAERSRPAIKYSDTPIRKEANALLEGGTFYEMLLVNSSGFITEGSRTNVFFIKDDTLITPPARDVLPGITRQRIFEIAQHGGIALVEKAVHRSSLVGFCALFLTGTSAKVLPVRSVEDLSFRTDDALLRQVMVSYDRCITSYLDGAARRTTKESSKSLSKIKRFHDG